MRKCIQYLLYCAVHTLSMHVNPMLASIISDLGCCQVNAFIDWICNGRTCFNWLFSLKVASYKTHPLCCVNNMAISVQQLCKYTAFCQFLCTMFSAMLGDLCDVESSSACMFAVKGCVFPFVIGPLPKSVKLLDTLQFCRNCNSPSWQFPPTALMCSRSFKDFCSSGPFLMVL